MHDIRSVGHTILFSRLSKTPCDIFKRSAKVSGWMGLQRLPLQYVTLTASGLKWVLQSKFKILSLSLSPPQTRRHSWGLLDWEYKRKWRRRALYFITPFISFILYQRLIEAVCVNKEGKSDSNRLSSVIAVSLGRCWLHELWWPLIHDLPDSPYFMSCFKMVTKSSYINAIRCACRISSEGSHLSELLEPVFPFSQNRLATVIKNCSVLMGKWLFRCIFLILY